MDLVVIAGFLGSGKTTLLLRLAKHLSASGNRKIAVIENEVGKIGIDDETLREEGLNVRELYSGCICCSLRVNLVTTLLELERTQQPDLVIVEPSGVAGPGQVADTLTGYGGHINHTIITVLFDAKRFKAIQDLSFPLMTGSVESADLAVLSKIDLVDPEALPALDERIRSIRDDVPILHISTERDEGVEDFLCQIETLLSATDEPPTPIDESTTAVRDVLPGAVAHAESRTIRFPTAHSGADAANRIAQALDVIVKRLYDAGCRMIGHIKAIVRDPHDGYLVLNITEFDTPAQTRGNLAQRVEEASIRLNLIVFGVDREDLARWVDEALMPLSSAT